MDPKKLKALRQKRADLVAANQRMLDEIDAEDRSFTDDEQTAFDNRGAQIEALDRRIDNELSQAARASRSVIEGDDVVDAIIPEGAVHTHRREEDAPWDGHTEDEQFGSFLSAVRGACHPQASLRKADPRLMRLIPTEHAASGLSEAVPADGGFMVDKGTSDRLLEAMFASGMILSRVQRLTLSNPSLTGMKIRKQTEISRRNGSRWGGIVAYWEGEGDLFTASKPEFAKSELTLHKLTGLAYATNESLNDIAILGQIISQGFVNEMRFKAEDGIVNGTGSGQPMGFFNSPCKVTVAKETGQTADTIVVENLVKMRARADSRFRNGGLWIHNQDCEPTLYTMGITIGTGGSPVWMPANNIAGRPYSTIYGHPAEAVEYCDTVGNEGDIAFVCPQEYYWLDRGSVRQDSSIHVRFLYDEMAFRFVYFADGQPGADQPITPYKGVDTLSPFVTLAAR